MRTVMAAAAGIAGLVLTGFAPGAPAPPDRQPPTKPTIDGQLRPTILRPVFTFGATDRRTPRGKIRFRCAFDGTALRPCARIHRPIATLSFGQHTLRVRALDLAGNGSRVTSFSFVVVGSWDAASDFERAPRPANPGRDRYGNTTWSYLYGGREHDPATYQLLPTFAVVAEGWEAWHILPNALSASVALINTQIVLHPGPSTPGQNAVLAWRSPLAATVSMEASVSTVHPVNGCSVPANGISWSIDQGARTLRAGTLAALGTVENVKFSTTVAAGESLYVVVGDRGDSSCDATGVRLLIETD